MGRYYMFLVVLARSLAGQSPARAGRRFMTGLCLSKAYIPEIPVKSQTHKTRANPADPRGVLVQPNPLY
jgi:hypothetical protein